MRYGGIKIAEQTDKKILVSDGSKSVASSLAWAPHGTAAGLGKIEDAARELGYDFSGVEGLTWKFANEYGARFGAQLPELLAQARDPVAMADILKTIVQINGVDKVNAFLRENGYSIQLKEPESAEYNLPVAAASILDILVEWAKQGTPTKLKLAGTGREVDAVKMIGRGVDFYASQHNPKRLIVELQTKGQDKVYLTNYDGVISDGLGLGELVAKLSASRERYYGNVKIDRAEFYEGVVFPMVDFSYKGDIDWLLGATSPLPNSLMYALIKQALIEQRLRMNEKGARAQQAVAVVGYLLGVPPPPKLYELNGRQLVVWFERPDKNGNPIVPYSALVTPEHMKNPGSLD